MRPLIAGNWKMHGLAAQLHEIETISESIHAIPPSADVVICVPATLISRAVQTAAGQFAVGGEDCHAEVSGPHTGDISAEMLRDAGASAVIVGHSDRRRDHQETDAIVAAKAAAARRAGIFPIVCIGESKTERSNGQAFVVTADQLAGSLPRDLAAIGTVAIAYEPLWAIGSGNVPVTDQIAEMHRHLRDRLIMFAGASGADIRILYGGSVTADNVTEILGLENVDGVLIGGASLLAADFDAVLRSIPETPFDL